MKISKRERAIAETMVKILEEKYGWELWDGVVDAQMVYRCSLCENEHDTKFCPDCGGPVVKFPTVASTATEALVGAWRAAVKTGKKFDDSL